MSAVTTTWRDWLVLQEPTTSLQAAAQACWRFWLVFTRQRLGVIGLFSISGGLRNMVGDTLSQVEGLMVLRENSPSPVFSQLPASMIDELVKVPGVRVVAPEVFGIAPAIEGRNMIGGFMAAILVALAALSYWL